MTVPDGRELGLVGGVRPAGHAHQADLGARPGGVGHLRGHGALPDEVVEPQRVAAAARRPRLVGGAERLAGGADGLVGLLGVLHLALVAPRRVGDVLAPVQRRRLGPGRRQGLVRQRGGVGAHVGDPALLVEALGHLHGPLGPEAQLAAGLLLQRRGHERRCRRAAVGLLGHRPHGEGLAGQALRPGAVASARPGARRRLWSSSPGLGEVAAGGHRRPAHRHQVGARSCLARRRRRSPSRSHHVAGPEPHPGPLALDDHPGGHALDAPGRQPGHHLLPQDRRHLVAVEAVEDAAGLLGVDQPAVEVAPVLHGALQRRRGDLVEHHPLDRHPGREHLGEVPGDRLALAVLVCGQVDLAGVARAAT